MTADVTFYDGATVNNVPFAISDSQQRLKHDNSCVMGWYNESGGDGGVRRCCARIQRIFTHCQYKGTLPLFTTNILQIYYKYTTNILQIFYKYSTNILQTYYTSGGVEHVFIECEWLDVLPNKSATGLLQVQSNANHPWNTSAKFNLLKECAPYNVAFLPQRPDDPSCTTFAVLDRHGSLGIDEG